MKLKIKTENSVYEWDRDEKTLTRLSEYPLRRDNELVRVVLMRHLELGVPMVVVLDIREDGIETVRLTTNVVSIEASTT